MQTGVDVALRARAIGPMTERRRWFARPPLSRVLEAFPSLDCVRDGPLDEDSITSILEAHDVPQVVNAHDGLPGLSASSSN